MTAQLVAGLVDFGLPVLDRQFSASHGVHRVEQRGFHVDAGYGLGGLESTDSRLEAWLVVDGIEGCYFCLLYTSPSPRDVEESRMPSSA